MQQRHRQRRRRLDKGKEVVDVDVDSNEKEKPVEVVVLIDSDENEEEDRIDDDDDTNGVAIPPPLPPPLPAVDPLSLLVVGNISGPKRKHPPPKRKKNEHDGAVVVTTAIEEDNNNKKEEEKEEEGDAKNSMWTVKYDPHTVEDLIVHKKKVEEVQRWLESATTTATATATKKKNTTTFIIISGPPGSGKKATVRVLGRAMGYHLMEWQAPSHPTYQEVQYTNQSTGTGKHASMVLPYVSAIDSFEEFISRARMPPLALTTVKEEGGEGEEEGAGEIAELETTFTKTKTTAAARKHPSPPLILIDDVPLTINSDQRMRLARSLSDLARSGRYPVILFATTGDRHNHNQSSASSATAPPLHSSITAKTPDGLLKEVSVALIDTLHVPLISFNPVTVRNTVKVLQRILEQERRSLGEGQVGAIAEQANGDVRNAIHSLQFACTSVRQQPHRAAVQQRQPRTKQKKAATTDVTTDAVVDTAMTSAVTYMLRDTFLNAFHGLGKLLYNKRVPVAPPEPSTCMARAPMDGFTPDTVLSSSGLSPPSVIAFLHENILDFIQEDATFDIAACATQLSSADVLYAKRDRGTSAALPEDDDGGGGGGGPLGLTQICAATVAARGVCFWNTHPAPSQWRPLRAPAVFTAQKGMRVNGEALHLAAGVGRVVYGGSGGLQSASVVATEILPAVRLISSRFRSRSHHLSAGGTSGQEEQAKNEEEERMLWQQPGKWVRYWNGKLHEQIVHGPYGTFDADGQQQARRGAGGEGGGVEGDDDPIEDPGW